MMPSAVDLDRLERWLLATITHPAGIAAGLNSPEARRHVDMTPQRLAEVIAPSSHQSAAERLAVYSNAYFARLLAVLRELFPCTRYAVGDELFDQFAVGYLRTHPPHSYTLARLADKLVDHLDATRPADWGAFIVELARLEQAIDRIFDAPGPERLPSLTVPASAGPEMRLRLVPGAELHAFAYPASSFYTAWRAGDAPPWPPPQPQYVALFRRDYVVRRYELSEVQYELLLSLHRGASLEETLGAVAKTHDRVPIEDLAAQIGDWFRFWSAERFFTAASP